MRVILVSLVILFLSVGCKTTNDQKSVLKEGPVRPSDPSTGFIDHFVNLETRTVDEANVLASIFDSLGSKLDRREDIDSQGVRAFTAYLNNIKCEKKSGQIDHQHTIDSYSCVIITYSQDSKYVNDTDLARTLFDFLKRLPEQDKKSLERIFSETSTSINISRSTNGSLSLDCNAQNNDKTRLCILQISKLN